MDSNSYDYIIAGAGLSGLSLARDLVNTPSLSDKRILLVDRSFHADNSKTWSFWHAGTPPFESLIHKSWRQAKVTFNGQPIIQPLQSYTYHSIQSGTFRKQIIEELWGHPRADLVESSIEALLGDDNRAMLETPDKTYSASYIFQSCFTPPALQDDAPHYPLIQHFLGWEVETREDVFDPSTITLMDFDPNFDDGIAFIYILPHAPNKALLEYTVFSKAVQPRKFYEEKLSIYIHNKFKLGPLEYNTTRTEYGEIPMRDQRYAPWYAPRVLNIGTVGGLTKPSTGYTFTRIHNHTEAIIRKLQEKGTPALPYRSPLRYRAFDLWLLQILHDRPQQALEIFRQLFTNNSLDEVFRFLAEDSTLLQDLQTISRVSYGPFLRAMWQSRRRLWEL